MTRLEELDLANRQLANAFKIVRTVGNHMTLKEVCAHLIGQIGQIVTCGRMAIVTVDPENHHAFIYVDDRLESITADESTRLGECITDIDSFNFVKTGNF